MARSGLINRILSAAALLVINVGVQPLAAAEPDTARITAYLRTQMRLSGTPGVAVAVIQHGEIVYEAGLGKAGGGRDVGPETPFILGSVSKPITSLAVMRLVESERLELDAPVARYLPDFRVGPDGPAQHITVRHLLQHRSGIPRKAGFRRFDPESPAPSSYSDVQLNSAPGTMFEYSNLNYVLLGRIIEAVTGQSFGSYLRNAVLEPAGMTMTFTRRMDAEAAGLASGHAFVSAVAVPWREPAHARAAVPAGFVIASARDMARFLAVQMAASGAPELLTRDNLTAMHRPGDGEPYGYGMGWRVVPWRASQEPLIAHDGLIGRYSAAIGFLPESGLGVVVLTNSNAGVFGPIATEMLVGTLQIAQGGEPRTGWPMERLMRTGIAVLLVFGVVGLGRRIRQWSRAGRPRGRPPLRHLVSRGIGAVLAVLILLLLPGWFGISLDNMLRLQPDLGGALVLGALVAVANAVLKVWLVQGGPDRTGVGRGMHPSV